MNAASWRSGYGRRCRAAPPAGNPRRENTAPAAVCPAAGTTRLARGKDSYEVDRVAGEQFSAIYPGIVDIARADRAFLGRVIRFLAGEAGVRQFLDVGTGLPTADNTHQVAQRVAPESRIVYVDNDPLVLAHARALLRDGPPKP